MAASVVVGETGEVCCARAVPAAAQKRTAAEAMTAALSVGRHRAAGDVDMGDDVDGMDILWAVPAPVKSSVFARINLPVCGADLSGRPLPNSVNPRLAPQAESTLPNRVRRDVI